MSTEAARTAGPFEGHWHTIPTEWLKAELLRRQETTDRPACGSSTSKHGYNTPAHVAALVIILALSTAACSFPIIVRRFPSLPIPHKFLFLSRHFGTGVLIATAFVHLLPTAFVSLHDPCLPPFWNKDYTAAAGFIAMVAMLVVVGIEMFFAVRGAAHSHSSEFGMLPQEEEVDYDHSNHRRRAKRTHSFRGIPDDHSDDIALGKYTEEPSATLMNGCSPSLPDRSHLPPASTKANGTRKPSLESDSDLDLDELDNTPIPEGNAGLLNGRRIHRRSSIEPESQTLGDGGALSDSMAQKKALLQVMLLEAGILFHSIFIGMALSTAMGTSFVVLLVAISFHQTFEGFALGARISVIPFPVGSIKPWLMALAYGTTTPIGQAIGLLIHNLYDPFSQVGLLMVGIMNAISSGMLLYAGLVTLMAEDFLSDASYETLKGRRRLQACASVVAGAGLMALVGAWA